MSSRVLLAQEVDITVPVTTGFPVEYRLNVPVEKGIN